MPLEATDTDVDTQLRGSIANPKLMRRIEDEQCVGGMARAARAVASLPGNLVIGGQVRKILDSFLCEFPHVVDDCTRAIGSEAKDAGPKSQDVETYRVKLGRLKIGARILETELHRSAPGCCLRGPIWRMTQGKWLLVGFVMVLQQALFPSLCLPVSSLWRS